MRAKVMDTETGAVAWKEGLRGFAWAMGEWSCDCNRQHLFGNNIHTGRCLGSHRYLVVDMEYDDGEERWTLEEMNEEYPRELLERHGIVKGVEAKPELKPCPMCGSLDVHEMGNAVWVRSGDNGGWMEFWVGCLQCGVKVGVLHEDDREARKEAIERWNRRVT